MAQEVIGRGTPFWRHLSKEEEIDRVSLLSLLDFLPTVYICRDDPNVHIRKHSPRGNFSLKYFLEALVPKLNVHLCPSMCGGILLDGCSN